MMPPPCCDIPVCPPAEPAKQILRQLGEHGERLGVTSGGGGQFWGAAPPPPQSSPLLFFLPPHTRLAGLKVRPGHGVVWG